MMQWSQLGFTETISIAVVAGAIWVVYLFIIFRRHSLPEVAVRSLLLAITVCCLCLIIYKPQYRLTKAGEKALLITHSTNTIPDSLLVFALPDLKTPAGVQKVPDLGFIERNYPGIQKVYIAGYNLGPEETKNLQRLTIRFLEKEAPAGFNWLSYSRQVKEGEEFVVSGTYRNLSEDTLKLLLSTLEGLQDSVLLVTGENRFSLQATTQLAGNYVANLHLINGDSTRTELLPYVVEEKQPQQILMLQGFPSFEMNYLKEWLGQAKHQIQLRARISRDKYATQSINFDQKAEIKPLLSEEALEETNLLICDAESLRQLSESEKKRLKEAVERGLGVLVLADEAWLKNPRILSYKFILTSSKNLSFTPRQRAQAAQGKILADKLPAAFAENPMLVPVAYSVEEEITAAYVPVGKGRVGAMLATATFPWILQGESAVYNRLWTDILQTLSRRQPGKDIRLAEFPFILKNHPTHFLVTDTVLTTATIKYTSGTRQLAMPKRGLPRTVETAYQFLPTEEGWIQMSHGEDTTLNHQAYILPANAWQDLKQASWWRQNQQLISTGSSDEAYSFVSWEEIRPIWFFFPLIASLALLWWREKQEAIR